VESAINVSASAGDPLLDFKQHVWRLLRAEVVTGSGLTASVGMKPVPGDGDGFAVRLKYDDTEVHVGFWVPS
jgi:hypothetical protein